MGLPLAMLVILAAAVVMALVAVPLALGRVPRNRLYGIRTRRTLADDAVWYDTNAYGGRGLIVASTVTVVVIAVLGALPLPSGVVVPASAAALVVPSLIACLLAVRHAGRIARRNGGT